MTEETKEPKAKPRKPRIRQKKTPMQEQPPKERIKNHSEVPYGYTEAEAMTEAARCLNCKVPFCRQGCPVEIDIPAFIQLVAEGKFKEAAMKVKETNALPAVCGRVCPQEEQCEARCVVGKKNEPVAIGRLERFVADWEAANTEIELPELPPPTGKKVAIVGCGPAGITAAADLLQMGHAVTIFEALHEPGGVLTYGIPEFRLPKSIVRREVDYVVRMGAELVLNFVVGTTRTVDELMEEYDAIFLGTGAGLPWFMNIPGEELNGIYSANEYLTRANLMKAYKFPDYDTPIIRPERVAVIGGGNVAMDSARTARRLGARQSIIVYRRSREEMPARLEEIHHGEEEGLIFEYLTSPVAFHGDEEGWVKEMECIRNKLGEPDSSGRRRPVPIEGSNFRIPIDIAVISIGQSPNPLVPLTTPGLETAKWGNIKVDEKMRTTRKGIFAAGDVATGGATVILAMGGARTAARAIDEYLKTGGWIEETAEA